MQARRKIEQAVPVVRFNVTPQNIEQSGQLSAEQSLLQQIAAYLQSQHEQNLVKSRVQLEPAEETNPLDKYPAMMTAAHISEHLIVSRRRVYELFQTDPSAGGIPVICIGGSKRVKKESFQRWIDGLESGKQGPKG